MNRREVGEIRDFFESYELMEKMINESNGEVIIKVSVYENSKKESLNIKVIERIVSHSTRKTLSRMGHDINDNLFCEFNLNYNLAKITFRINSFRMKEFVKLKGDLIKKYKCKFIGTNFYVEMYNPKIEDVMNIFTDVEKFCKRVII